MILDAGIAEILRRTSDDPDGNLPSDRKEVIYRSYYGERTIGITRYYTAKQNNVRVDKLIRILRHEPGIEILTDDLCRISDHMVYRIVQAQYLRDEESGADCIDISLERIGEKLEGT